jgi:formin-binding protein 1
VTLGAKNHNFKSQTFKIPTNCDLCGERIWGLSAKGFDCRDCGYTCHSKCEMKVPAECPGEQSKEERKKLKQERQEAANSLLKPTATPDHVAELPDLSRSNTMNSLSSGYAASARRPASGPVSPSEETPPEVPNTRPPAAASSGAARKNRVIAPPPSAYISELPGSVPNGSSSNGSGEQKGKMLYGFDAGSDGEISVTEGRDIIVLEPDSMYRHIHVLA